MTGIQFPNSSLYEYVKALTYDNWKNDFPITFHDETHSIEISHPELVHLLTRLSKQQPTVLPYLSKDFCFWMITAADEQSLDKTLYRLKSFIYPSYTDYRLTGEKKIRHNFDSKKGGLNQLGEKIFPFGYYMLRSPKANKSKILKKLGTWVALEEQKPVIVRRDRVSYFDLYNQFLKAMVAGDWASAEEAVDSIRRRSLSTADNIYFLKVQLWAAQKKWERIWDLPDYPELSKLTMPRAVRAALLSAFYWQVLSPREDSNELKYIFQAFDDYRSKLGRLLTGRFEIQQPEVIRVFAYLSTKDQNWEGFNALRLDAEKAGLVDLITILEKQIPHDESTNIEKSTDFVLMARQAMLSGDYDAAVRYAVSLEDKLEQILLLLQVAVLSGDQSASTIDPALQAHDNLNETQKNELAKRYPQVPGYLRSLENLINQPEFPSAWPPDVAQWRTRAWKVITEFEIRQRKLVENKYRQFFGKQWWNKINPDFIDRWQRAAENKLDITTAIDILDYSYITDLDKLTRHNWDFFKEVFGKEQSDRTKFKKCMSKIITVRNTLAHNRETDVIELKEVVQYCIEMIKKLDTKLGGNPH